MAKKNFIRAEIFPPTAKNSWKSRNKTKKLRRHKVNHLMLQVKNHVAENGCSAFVIMSGDAMMTGYGRGRCLPLLAWIKDTNKYQPYQWKTHNHYNVELGRTSLIPDEAIEDPEARERNKYAMQRYDLDTMQRYYKDK